MNRQFTKVLHATGLDESGCPRAGHKIVIASETDGFSNFESATDASLIADLIEIQEEFCIKDTDFNKILTPMDFTIQVKEWSMQIRLKLTAYPQQNKIHVTCPNGDLGVFDPQGAEGKTFAEAVFRFATRHGFKSTLKTNGELGLYQWFLNFNYGLERISNEILEREMDEMFEREKGTW